MITIAPLSIRISANPWVSFIGPAKRSQPETICPVASSQFALILFDNRATTILPLTGAKRANKTINSIAAADMTSETRDNLLDL
jgi:hypothetical protein